jgi:hypothetical protein
MLIFVYNADAGSINALLDSAHKILSPSTYACRLCELTYGLVREKQAWKAFRESLAEPVTFLHRDEFEQQYARHISYPALLRVHDSEFDVLLSAESLQTVSSTEELIERCREVIA